MQVVGFIPCKSPLQRRSTSEGFEYFLKMEVFMKRVQANPAEAKSCTDVLDIEELRNDCNILLPHK